MCAGRREGAVDEGDHPGLDDREERCCERDLVAGLRVDPFAAPELLVDCRGRGGQQDRDPCRTPVRGLRREGRWLVHGSMVAWLTAGCAHRREAGPADRCALAT